MISWIVILVKLTATPLNKYFKDSLFVGVYSDSKFFLPFGEGGGGGEVSDN